MTLPGHKTKIVCTIGPASDSQETVEAMIRAGMNVARINFSHGDFAGHKRVIETVRAASSATGGRVAIMADLPGPKMRIGDLAEEPFAIFSCLAGEDLVGSSGFSRGSVEEYVTVYSWPAEAVSGCTFPTSRKSIF